jgi:hypothetical protein
MYIGYDNLSGYAARYGRNSVREDGDGRIHMFARCNNGATAMTAHVLYPNMTSAASGGCGYFATQLFATGFASLTALYCQSMYYIGVNNDTIATGADGWLQIAGPVKGFSYATQDISLNALVQWRIASVCATIVATMTTWLSTFAISCSSISQGTYDIYMLGNPVMGIG